MGKLFGTDGVRGKINDDLTVQLAMRIGVAAGYVLGKNKKVKVIIGRDSRYSGQMLTMAVASGLLSCGAEVIDVGIVPTPAVSYLTKELKCDIGIMISASHNPSVYNGIKIFNNEGYKLADEVEEQIENYILNEDVILGDNIGKYTLDLSLKDKYISYLENECKINKDLKIVVDCANGSASETAPILFKKISKNVSFINREYDGYNINENAGSTHLDSLISAVKKNKADIGVAYDGDADRCMLVSSSGKIIGGDFILAICAKYYKNQGKLKNNTVVGTVMSNLGLKKFCETNDIGFEATKVGDRYVLESMMENDYLIGGEQSGHIIFRHLANTGDGELTSIQILNIMSDTGKSLDELAKVMTNYPQVLVNVSVTKEGKEKYKDDKEIMDLVASISDELADNGRVLIRPSGTERIVRVMIEGVDISDITDKANLIANKIKEKFGE